LFENNGYDVGHYGNISQFNFDLKFSMLKVQ